MSYPQLTPYARMLIARGEISAEKARPLTARELEKHERRINAVLEKTALRRGEAIVVRTPADEVELREELRELEAKCLAAVEEFGDDRWALYSRWFDLWFEFLYEDGPHPQWPLRRLYMLARRYKPALIAHMNGTELGMMWGITRAAESDRLQQLFDRLHFCGVAGFRGGGAKCEETRKTFAATSKGNKNRRGKKSKKKK